jgi:maltose-binding protein MalE
LRYIGGSDFQVAFQKKANNIPANADARAQLTDKNLAAFGAAGLNAYPMPAWVFLDAVWAKIGQAEQALVWGTSTGTPGDFLRKAVTSLQSTVDAA